MVDSKKWNKNQYRNNDQRDERYSYGDAKRYQPEDDLSDVSPEDEKWNPTPEAFENFLVLDYALAQSNVELAMQMKDGPISFKELKDSTLHSADVLERVLSSKIASGQVTEVRGKYTLLAA